MMNCIARHNVKLRNDVFSNENGGPGILLSLSLFKMHQKNVLVHARWTGWKPRFHRFFEDFKERKWSLIVVAVSTPPFFFFENCKKKSFDCCCSIDSPVFLRWKWLKTHWRRIFSGFFAYSKARKVSRFLFAISTASLYAAENAFVFGSRRLP